MSQGGSGLGGGGEQVREGVGQGEEVIEPGRDWVRRR